MLSVAVTSASVLLVIGLLIYATSVYNNLVRASRLIDQTFSNIDVVLKQRWDEIPRIVEVCKGYMAHERELLEEISRIRAGYGKARTTDEKIGVENLLTGALAFFHAAFEAYPDLKAIQSVVLVQRRMSDIESNIADRRELFNDTVTRYNIYVQQIPPLLIARAFGYRERPLLAIRDRERALPEKPFAAA
jgi:LemA protein